MNDYANTWKWRKRVAIENISMPFMCLATQESSDSCHSIKLRGMIELSQYCKFLPTTNFTKILVDVTISVWIIINNIRIQAILLSFII